MNRIAPYLPPDPLPADQAQELKPCPFCGGKAEIVAVDPPDADRSYHEHGFLAQCVDDNCDVCVVAGPCETAAEVAEQWNNRRAM